MLDKTYRPAEVEQRQYARAEQAGAFACGQQPEARPYTIVIPPPNVTGSLHMGHALNNTVQDVLIRLERMRGRDVLWQPGTDHAGIATQMVVERQLAEKGLSRRDLGRERFVERVWSWKEHSGGTITEQLRRLGASCDWSRERFTMDEGLSAAVRKVFVDLYKQGLIYRDKRLVNWDCKLKTAISDLEVEQRDVKGFLWHFKYAIEDTENEYITVATTRPETMLGDTAVAVHPEDPRYRDLVGKFALLPLVGRRLPIIADEHADPEQGSGAVKITPAHDFNDFEVGRRHDLELVNVFDEEAHLNDNVPEPYRGLDRFVARDKVVADLEALGLVETIEEHRYVAPYGDRSGVVIEPWLTDQWYVDAATLAKPAIAAVERGETVFVPRTWEKTFFAWMRDIQPWCISRQLWWGHQIPAWYAPDGKVFVEATEEAAHDAAKVHYGKNVSLERDPDVLDTWFSSQLWPFSTLGWPERTPELERYYPTDVLVTGFDIIFFWVARMMMIGLHFTGQVPFHTVYIHALVRDEKGHKMAKSRGNIIDPLELIEKFGADALRFTLAAMAAQGRDIKLSESRVAGYRNFGTKLWNAARFCEMNGCRPAAGFEPEGCRETVNRWIVGEVAKATERVTLALDAYKFNEAADAIYHFTWGIFCDWYLEFIKPVLMEGAELEREETRACAAWTLEQVLHLLHPFMPFITEELWERLADPALPLLAVSPWPDHSDLAIDAEAEAEMGWLTRLIGEVRAVRAEMHVPAAARIEMRVNGANDESRRRLAAHDGVVRRLARLGEVAFEGGTPRGSVQIVLDEAMVVLPLAGIIDVESERSRLQRELDKTAQEIARIEKKLANRGFIAKAPEHVVEEQRERRHEAELARGKLTEAIERLRL
jgi:valyl-tRNA synthetase